jgi:hypothetical protein
MDRTQTILSLVAEVRELRNENTGLRKRLAVDNRHARRVEQAYEDALLLATWRASGIHPSRRYARLMGMGKRRWAGAVALLRGARVVVRVRHWSTDDLASIDRRLGLVKQRVLTDRERFLLWLK